MTNIFNLNQVVSKNKYNKGVATARYDVVDLESLGRWLLSAYKMGDGRLEDYPQMLITLQKDAEERSPYGGDEDFKASCSEKLSRCRDVHLVYGITLVKRPFIWPLVVVEDLMASAGI